MTDRSVDNTRLTVDLIVLNHEEKKKKKKEKMGMWTRHSLLIWRITDGWGRPLLFLPIITCCPVILLLTALAVFRLALIRILRCRLSFPSFYHNHIIIHVQPWNRACLDVCKEQIEYLAPEQRYHACRYRAAEQTSP